MINLVSDGGEIEAVTTAGKSHDFAVRRVPYTQNFNVMPMNIQLPLR